MLLNSIYYSLKPAIPRPVRLAIRRKLAFRKLDRVRDFWPILPGSEQPPKGWPGWPEGKKFALVLTHDVEEQRGLARVPELAELEMEVWFSLILQFRARSRLPRAKGATRLAHHNGFEVGVHDMHHDGKLFRSRRDFARRAPYINHYLEEWNAAGFRSGFMMRRLSWLHELDIAYDMSTFDTDPFEPQPDGVNTIFPFWVPRRSTAESIEGSNHQRSTSHEVAT